MIASAVSMMYLHISLPYRQTDRQTARPTEIQKAIQCRTIGPN